MKRVALVTGGSRGIGFGIAEQLAQRGFDLAIMGVREEEQVIESLKSLTSAGAEVLYCRGSLAKSDDRRSVVAAIRHHFGRLHVLVNNAGMAPRQRNDILQTTEASFDEVLRTNLYGTFFLTQLVANWQVEQKQHDAAYQGCIINISSISATVASVNRGEYCISKAGMSMVTQLFAVRLGEYDIPVYEIRPGIIKTDMTAAVAEKYDAMIADGLTVQRRWGLPEDVGKTAAVLACDEVPYATGSVIMVDGGLTIQRL